MPRFSRRFATALACAAILLPAGLRAQENALHVEVLGPALLGSVNYERIFAGSFSARVGLGYMPEMLEYRGRVQAPVLLNTFLGRGEHRVEAGAGVVVIYARAHSRPEEEQNFAPAGFEKPDLTGTLAWRWQPGGASRLHRGVYRAGFTPLVRNGTLYPLVGVSAGIMF
ncbi:MAG TPA: hypothetical protein VHG08_01575 [Longimicrobium sp.]|nr:hypothetical protein [Longimicrobium sp.]